MNARALALVVVVVSGCGFVSVVEDPLDGGPGGGLTAAGPSGGGQAGGAQGGGATSGGLAGGMSGVAGGTASCTPKSERNAWPVKVVFVVQNSGSMCVVDPPGSTGTGGLCEMIPAPGLTSPARVRAIRRFLADNQTRSNLSVAMVSWGMNGVTVPFTSPSALEQSVLALQSNLVSGANLQAALLSTKRLIDADIAQSPAAVRGHTRYVVILLGTGLPSPRCSANDAMTIYANAAQPELTWADSDPAFCNPDPSGPEVLGPFIPGTDLNQNRQLRQAASDLAALGPVHHLGSLELHTRLVLDGQTLDACGPLCRDAFAGLTSAEVRAVGTYTLGQVAMYGRGTFADPGALTNLEGNVAAIDTRELTTFCEVP